MFLLTEINPEIKFGAGITSTTSGASGAFLLFTGLKSVKTVADAL